MSQQVLRKIAGMLIAVLLATVLSPSFGWESAASQSTHGHDVMMLDDHDGFAGQHQGDEDSHHHHGCAGHVLGHLPVQLSEPFVFAALDLADSVLPEPASDFSSHLTERLNRPPRAPALA